jgi:hypothetical protein
LRQPKEDLVSSALTDPFMMPAAPTPAIARPIIKDTEFGAAPQMAEAISNITMLARIQLFTEKKV